MFRRSSEPASVAAKPATGTVGQTRGLLLVAFAAVYIVWGSTYLAIRIGIETIPPFLLAGSRHLVTGLILYPILRWKTGIRPTSAQ